MSDNKGKLTDQHLRIIQLIAGIISGTALIIALFIAGPSAGENVLLQYLWLIVFVVIMFGRRWVERKFRVRLAFFNLVLINTLVISILIYLALMFYSPLFDSKLIVPGWSDALKLIVIIVPSLAVIILGFILPLKRYFKRKEEGTLRPIRLPEPKEPEESDEEPVDSGPMTIEQQIAAMTKELDDKNDQNK
jgi:magnesium-transporting ATPase (P-type)